MIGAVGEFAKDVKFAEVQSTAYAWKVAWQVMHSLWLEERLVKGLI